MEMDTYVEAGPGTEAGFFVWITRRSNRERKLVMLYYRA